MEALHRCTCRITVLVSHCSKTQSTVMRKERRYRKAAGDSSSNKAACHARQSTGKQQFCFPLAATQIHGHCKTGKSAAKNIFWDQRVDCNQSFFSFWLIIQKKKKRGKLKKRKVTKTIVSFFFSCVEQKPKPSKIRTFARK